MASGVSGSVSFYSAGNTIRVYYAQTFTPGVAKSTVTISKVTLQSDRTLGGSFFFDGKIIVNGEVVYSRSIAGSDGGVTVDTDENVINLCHGESVTVYHSAATTISIQLAANTQGVPCFYQYGYGSLTIPAGSRSVTLTAIPMASAISAVAVPLESEMAISLTKAATGLTDTVTWQCGTQSGTIAENSSLDTFAWTPPLSLASQAPDSTSVSITLTTATKNGSTAAGSSSVTVSCPIPASVKPTVSLAISDEMGYLATFGSFIRSQSKARVATTAAGIYGSAITGISVTCGTLTGSGENLLFALANAGTVTVSVTVTDSRGRTAAAEVQIYVADYSPPAPEITALYRCNADGTAAADGAWAKAELRCAISSLGGKNTAACVLKYRVRGTESWTEKAVTAPGSTVFSAGTGSDYQVQLTASDSFATVSGGISLLPAAFALLDFDRTNKAVGIGQRAGTANAISLGLPIKMGLNRITDMGAPTDAADAATKGYVDTNKVDKANVVNNFTTTEEGYVADARALKVLNDSKLSMEPLWENASPTSSFAAQSIDLNLASFSLVRVVYISGISYPYVKYMYDFHLGETAILSGINSVVGEEPANSYFLSRKVTVNSDGVLLESGYSRKVNVTSPNTAILNNSSIIPILIYGIRGVVQ